jgi:hypothetical protein
MPTEHTNIEALQAERIQQVQLATKEQALRHLLNLLDPQVEDHTLTYAEVLQRLETVLTHERTALEGDSDGV